MTELVTGARTSPSVAAIQKRLDADLDRFYRELRERLRSDVFLIDQGARYLLRSRGKGVRPFLVLACARLFGEPTPLTYRAAMVVELFHTATLVHDDVVDASQERRGLPTFNRIWGGKYAVLFGDYLLAHSLVATLESRRLEIVDLLATAARRIITGQLKEWVRVRERDVGRESYFSMIGDKTAALFRACTHLSALTMDRPESDCRALSEFGESIGMAFQIRDDVLDFIGRRSLLRKPSGSDVRQGKFTLPLILALETASDADRSSVLGMIRSDKSRAKHASRIAEFVRKQDGIARAQVVAEDYARRGLSAIADVGDSEVRALLGDFVNSITQRTK